MAGFDAEGYLRLTGEQWLREGGSIDGPPWNPVLCAAGAALVAVGAMTNTAARAVIDEYHQALASGEGRRYLMSRQADRSVASAPPDIGQLRVVPCGRVIEQPWGRLTIHYVAFTDHATTLRVTLQPDQSQGHPFGLPPAGAAAKGDRRPRDDGGRGVLWRVPAW